MVDGEFADHLTSDSNDYECAGLELNEMWDINLEELDLNIELDDEDLILTENEIFHEESDLTFEVHECDWLSPFNINSGPQNIPEESEPYSIFIRYHDDEIIYLLVTETNLYNEQFVQSKSGVENLSRYVCARYWRPVASGDMKVFIVILLFMGLVRMPNYDMY